MINLWATPLLIIGSNHYETIAHQVKLQPTTATIKPYGCPPIPTKGKFTANLETPKGEIETILLCYKRKATNGTPRKIHSI